MILYLVQNLQRTRHKYLTSFRMKESREKMKSKTKTLGKLLRFAVEVCSGKHLGVGIYCEMRLLFHHQIKSIHYTWVIESIVEAKISFIYNLPKQININKDF